MATIYIHGQNTTTICVPDELIDQSPIPPGQNWFLTRLSRVLDGLERMVVRLPAPSPSPSATLRPASSGE